MSGPGRGREKGKRERVSETKASESANNGGKQSDSEVMLLHQYAASGLW